MRVGGAFGAKVLAVLVIVTTPLAPAVSAAEPAGAGSASGQAVIFWTTEAQRATVRVAQKNPGDATVFMAIVNAAIYDAVVAVEGGARPYAVSPRVPAGASSQAATAAAAHGVLVGMFPGQKAALDTNYDAYLATLPRDLSTAGGVAVGEEVAARMLELRAGDGRDAFVPYEQTPPGPGVFEPTAPFPPINTHLGQVRPLTLPHSRLFRPPGPPSLDSERYAADVNETAERGAFPPVHTPEERSAVRLWADHGIPQWNRTLSRLITARDLNIVEAARLMVMAHASGADAAIACYDAKYHYRFWRPIHAIQRADTDGNPATEAEPEWQPLLGTPNHPEYPAGHNCHSTAVATAIGRFFGTDEVSITVDSLSTGEARTFARLSDAVRSVIEARILGGVHFRAATEDGTALGAAVARFATDTQFTKIAR